MPDTADIQSQSSSAPVLLLQIKPVSSIPFALDSVVFTFSSKPALSHGLQWREEFHHELVRAYGYEVLTTPPVRMHRHHTYEKSYQSGTGNDGEYAELVPFPQQGLLCHPLLPAGHGWPLPRSAER